MSNERDPLYVLGYQKGFASAAIKGQLAERERIIALLEAEAVSFSEYCTLPLDEEHCQMCNHYVQLIALIKGN